VNTYKLRWCITAAAEILLLFFQKRRLKTANVERFACISVFRKKDRKIEKPRKKKNYAHKSE
jgi:hypothetical protein